MSRQPTHIGGSFPAAVANAVWRCVRSPALVWALWIVNVAMLCGLAIWILSDGQFSLAIDLLWTRVYALLERGTGASAYTWYAGRMLILAIIGLLSGVTAIGIFLGLFFGAAPHRRVRSWFAFTLLLAAWLTLFVSWHGLAWRGQVFRLRHRLAGFETVAQSLRTDWPTVDGDRPSMGPFMAYPIGRPTMLMMLTTPDVPPTKTSFSSIERSGDGALRFELIGDEPDAWLEWHPPGSTPRSFVGGLLNEYPLDRCAPLNGGWFLVRYKTGG